MGRRALLALALFLLVATSACRGDEPPAPPTATPPPTTAPILASPSPAPTQPPPVASATTAPPTAMPPVTSIHTIQGASHVTPYSFRIVENVPGIVTAKRPNGFYMQEPNPDTNDATSEGIFVFTNIAPTVNVGDLVSVRGLVNEARPGGESTSNLSITQIETPRITVISRNNPLPTPVVLGQAGRLPPTEIIDDLSRGDVERRTGFDPARLGLDFYESLESMLVQVNNAVVVGPRNRFGEIIVLADNGGRGGLRTPRGGIILRPTDYNPERIFVDDELLLPARQNTPSVVVGDRFTAPLVGPLDYSFGNYKIQLTQVPTFAAGGLTREATTPARPEQLVMAGFNVENLDPTDVGRFEALATAIVTNLRSPDLISLEEIQDNNGPFNDAIVDASRTYELLIQAIQAAGGPVYQVRQIDPVDDQDGGEPGGNIRVGFLFRTDRGLSFIDRPGATSTTPVKIERGPRGPQLSHSPGRIDPTNPAFASSRKPLVGEFLFNGNHLFVISNHLSSKGGDTPLFGKSQPPVLNTEAVRIKQAQVLAAFSRELLAEDSEAHLIIVGDLNDFQFAPPLSILKEAGLQVLIETLPENERYTYVFEGNSQTLDHILITAYLAQTAQPEFDVVHLNAEFADRLSDHDPTVIRLSLAPVTLQASPPPVIAWTAARQHMNEIVTAEGVIITTRNTGRVTYLNFSNNFQTDLKVVIFPREAALFSQPPETMFLNRKIRVTGRIEEFQGAPQIIVRDPKQIVIVP